MTIVRNAAMELARRLAHVSLTRDIMMRRSARKSGIILAFHEISAERLEQHLTSIVQHHVLVPLTELATRLREGQSTAGLVAVTFDDGIGGVVETAARLAGDRGWPMTFFLPTRWLDTGRPYWFQEFKLIVQHSTAKVANVGGITLSRNGSGGQLRNVEILVRRFYALSSEEEIAILLAETRAALTTSGTLPGELNVAPPISWERVRELSHREELDFEPHSVSHLALSRLPEDRIRVELEASRDRVAQFTNRTARHFCYPFGGSSEIGELAPRLVRAVFTSGVTMIRGRCTADCDVALLPRVPLYEQDDEAMVALKVGLA